LNFGFFNNERYSDFADSMTMNGTPSPSFQTCSRSEKQVLVFPAPVTPTMMPCFVRSGRLIKRSRPTGSPRSRIAHFWGFFSLISSFIF